MRGAEELVVATPRAPGAPCSSVAKIEPPSSLTTTIVRSGRGSSGPITSAVGVVQEGHVADVARSPACCAAGRARRRSRSRRCRRCRPARGWRAPSGARRRGRRGAIRSRSRIGLQAPTNEQAARRAARGVDRAGDVVRREAGLARPRSASSCRADASGRPRATPPARPGRRRRPPRRAPCSAVDRERPRRAQAPCAGAATTSTSSRASSRSTGRDSVGCPNDDDPLDPARRGRCRAAAGRCGSRSRRCASRWSARRAAASPPARPAPARAARRRRRRPRRCAGPSGSTALGPPGRARRGPRLRRRGRDRAGRPGGPSGTSGSSSWTLRCTGPVGDQPASSRPRPRQRRASAKLAAAPKTPDLVGGLVGAGAAQPRRPVGGDDDQRHAGVGGLEHGRVQVGRPRCRTS